MILLSKRTKTGEPFSFRANSPSWKSMLFLQLSELTVCQPSHLLCVRVCYTPSLPSTFHKTITHSSASVLHATTARVKKFSLWLFTPTGILKQRCAGLQVCLLHHFLTSESPGDLSENQIWVIFSFCLWRKQNLFFPLCTYLISFLQNVLWLLYTDPNNKVTIFLKLLFYFKLEQLKAKIIHGQC